VASYDTYYEQIKKQTAADRQAAKDKSNKIFENQKAVANEQYTTQLKDTTSAYDEQYRLARIQKAVNERQIAENMANMGLTDSGLNRTQITANQLSYGNRIGKIDTEKQKAADALALALRGNITTIENNRISAEAAIDDKYDKYASDAATDMYKADVAAASRSYSSGGGKASRSYSSGGGKKSISASLSDIKSAIKSTVKSKDDFNKIKATTMRRGNVVTKQRIVDGKIYRTYDEYKSDAVLNTLGKYAEAGLITWDEMDTYYTLLN